MEDKIKQLKLNFKEIGNIRIYIIKIFDILKIKIVKLKTLYKEFIDNNKNKLFIFGLDSFHFQNKIIDFEYDEMKKIFLCINNRMYCEYFKLYKIIVEYINENINDKKILDMIKLNNFPVYKDLEPFKEYNYEYILNIHENILIMISLIDDNINLKENELLLHKSKKNIGLNIDNFITTFNYDIITIKEKINLFISYIEFFHKLHHKYLKRFTNKIKLMFIHINHDIKLDLDDNKLELNIHNYQKVLNNNESILDMNKILKLENFDFDDNKYDSDIETSNLNNIISKNNTIDIFF